MASVIEKYLTRTMWWTGASLFGYGVATQCIFTVDGGCRGVILDRYSGVLDKVYTPGAHFKIPAWQYETIFDVKMKPKQVKTQTPTKDMQQVRISVRLLHRPEADMLPRIFKELGKDYDEVVLPSIMNEVMKQKVAKYNAEELLTKRAEVSSEIRRELIKRAASFHLKLADISITTLTFGEEFSKAIEQKQVAEQMAKRAEFLVMRKEHEKTAAVIRAQAEKESADLMRKSSLAGNGFVQLRKIEACKQIAETLSRSRNVAYLPSSGNGGSNLLLGLNQQ